MSVTKPNKWISHQNRRGTFSGVIVKIEGSAETLLLGNFTANWTDGQIRNLITNDVQVGQSHNKFTHTFSRTAPTIICSNHKYDTINRLSDKVYDMIGRPAKIYFCNNSEGRALADCLRPFTGYVESVSHNQSHITIQLIYKGDQYVNKVVAENIVDEALTPTSGFDDDKIPTQNKDKTIACVWGLYEQGKTGLAKCIKALTNLPKYVCSDHKLKELADDALFISIGKGLPPLRISSGRTDTGITGIPNFMFIEHLGQWNSDTGRYEYTLKSTPAQLNINLESPIENWGDSTYSFNHYLSIDGQDGEIEGDPDTFTQFLTYVDGSEMKGKLAWEITNAADIKRLFEVEGTKWPPQLILTIRNFAINPLIAGDDKNGIQFYFKLLNSDNVAEATIINSYDANDRETKVNDPKLNDYKCSMLLAADLKVKSERVYALLLEAESRYLTGTDSNPISWWSKVGDVSLKVLVKVPNADYEGTDEKASTVLEAWFECEGYAFGSWIYTLRANATGTRQYLTYEDDDLIDTAEMINASLLIDRGGLPVADLDAVSFSEGNHYGIRTRLNITDSKKTVGQAIQDECKQSINSFVFTAAGKAREVISRYASLTTPIIAGTIYDHDIIEGSMDVGQTDEKYLVNTLKIKANYLPEEERWNTVGTFTNQASIAKYGVRKMTLECPGLDEGNGSQFPWTGNPIRYLANHLVHAGLGEAGSNDGNRKLGKGIGYGELSDKHPTVVFKTIPKVHVDKEIGDVVIFDHNVIDSRIARPGGGSWNGKYFLIKSFNHSVETGSSMEVEELPEILSMFQMNSDSQS